MARGAPRINYGGNKMSSKQICPRCGSTHLNYEAIVSWSEGREVFEIQHVGDPIYCRDCEFEIVTTEEAK